jgi:hypothetical protein
MALSCSHSSCGEVGNKADGEEHLAHLEPSEHEHLIRKNLNGIAVKIEGNELAELSDGLQERRRVRNGTRGELWAEPGAQR